MKKIIALLLLISGVALGQSATQPQRAMYGSTNEIQSYPGLSGMFIRYNFNSRTFGVYAKDATDTTSPASDSVIVSTTGVRFKLLTDEAGSGGVGGGSVAWGDITGKPSTFTPASHNQAISTITGLQDSLNARQATITAGTSLQYYRGDKTWATLDKVAVGLGSVQNVDQTNASNLISGTIAAGRFGALTVPVSAMNASGTAGAGTFLRGDGVWASPSSSAVTSVAGRTGTVTLTMSDISGLGTAATFNVPSSGNAGTTEVVRGNDTRLTGLTANLAAKSDTSHRHNAAHLTSGTIPAARYGTGTIPVLSLSATGSTADTAVLRRNGTWAVISGGGGSSGLSDPGSNGILSRTASGTTTSRTFSVSGDGLSITNGTGVSGNPTYSLANDVAAIEALTSTGFAKRTGTDTWAISAVDLSGAEATGTLAAARMPALTGDITSSAGGVTTTYNNVVPANKGGAGAVSGIMKANGSGTVSAAAAGTDYVVPSGSITGTAANVSGTVAVANGGTGATTAAGARTNLGATTIGDNMFTLANPSAVTFPRFNADNTITSLSAASFLSAIAGAPLASPTFTGTPAAPTATAGTNTTQVATTAFVQTVGNGRVLSVDNVATLKTITGVAGQIVTTKGYYTDGDGGGNTYYWNTSSTTAKDSGSVFQVHGVTTGRWLSVEQKEVFSKRWGAKGDGSNDDTAYLTSALAYSVTNSKLLVFTEGDYKVSNYIMNATDFDGSENLFIKVVGNVKITASSGMSAIDKCIINYGKETTGNVSITGDALTVNLRSKFRGFFDIKNYGIVGGVYYTTIDGDFHCKLGTLVVKNSYAPTGGEGIAYGISVIGSYKRVTIENVTIDSVFRYNAVWGECKGINVSGTKGDVIINNCKVSNVRATAAYLSNADGINVFGEKQNTAIENSFRLGTATITNCVLSDNQGRNIKIQVSEATIQNCKFLRQYVTTIDNGHDVDVQFGNGKILNNTCIYKKNGGTSPLGTYFVAFKFQNVLPNAEQYSLARDNVFYTEAVIPYPFFITHGNVLSPDTVKSSIVDIVNNHVINTGTFVGTGSIQRGFCEFNADELNKVVDRCEINLRDNSFFASSTSALLSYNAPIYDVEDQLVFRLVGNKNTNTAQTPFLFHNYFGGQIDSIDVYQVWNNSGFSESFHTTWKINLSKGKIIAPSRIAFDLYYHSYLINKPPTIGTSGNAVISVLGDWASGNAKVEIYENTGGSNDYLHYSTSASTWKKATLN